MTDNKYTELITRYLEGELSADEIKQLKAELESNAELKEELRIQTNSDEFFKNTELLNFIDQIDEINSELKRKRKAGTWRIGLYSAAAVIVVLVSAYFVVQYTSVNKIDNAQIFAENYEFEFDTSKSRGVISDETFEAIKKLHAEKKYEQAIEELKVLINEDDSKVEALLYLSVMLIELEKYDDAIMNLENLIKQEENIFTDQIKWYLSLCYVKVESNEKAIKLLNELVDQNTFYKDKAKSVLLSLDRH